MKNISTAQRLIEEYGLDESVTINQDTLYKIAFEYQELEIKNSNLETQNYQLYAKNVELMSNNKILTEKIRTLKKQLKELLNK